MTNDELTVQPKHRAAWMVSGIVTVAGIALGDIAMATVCGLVREYVPVALLLQWFIAVVVIAVGGFALFGVPQLHAWKRGGSFQRDDPRVRWAVRLVEHGGGPAFFIASALGGPMVVAWYCGSTGLDHAYRRTAAASLILGLVWGAIYLGVIAAIF